ncbi:MAG: peptidylprolyl isomerase [Rickettsiales bacterium]|nr:peptidylprolyl isomerase [Rickettsiales bacterium]
MKKIYRALFILSLLLLINIKVSFSRDTMNIVKNKEADIVANVDNFAVTKYDLNNLIKVFNINAEKKILYTNSMYNDVLDFYIDILTKRIIAEKNNIHIDEDDKNTVWNTFRSNLNIKDISLKQFCKKNKIDENFLTFFLESNYLWMKYVEMRIKPNIKVSDKNIKEVSEYANKSSKIVRYNLSEIVLYYNNLEQKESVTQKINEIYEKLNNKNFGTMAFSMSKSTSADKGGLVGWIYENEMNSTIIDNIKNVNANSFGKPFCIGEENGGCYIFKVNDKVVEIKNSKEAEDTIRTFIFNQKLDTRVRGIINSNRQKINVVYR